MALGFPRVLLFLASSCALVLRRMPGTQARGDALHSTRLAAILLYMGIGLSPLVPFFTPPDASVVDGAGHVWLTHHIRDVSALLGLCTWNW